MIARIGVGVVDSGTARMHRLSGVQPRPAEKRKTRNAGTCRTRQDGNGKRVSAVYQQYSEMKTQITNDSLVAQLTAEQLKTEQLLKELRDTKKRRTRNSATEEGTGDGARRPAQLCDRNRLAQPPQPEPHGREHTNKRTVTTKPHDR